MAHQPPGGGGTAAPRLNATIVAPATPAGTGAVGIVRVSGEEALPLAGRLAGPLPAPGRHALRLVRDADGDPIDRGLVLVFRAPRSYTGEDLVEFQIHASPVLVERLVEALTVLGARPAGPGEFTRRAFINGRLDLAQAEAVVDLIEARDRAAARAALRSLEGKFSRRVAALDEALREARLFAEAGLDFSDQDIEADLGEGVRRALLRAADALARLRDDGLRGESLRREPRVLLLGRPNVGKSSLFNRLVGEERAIVTAWPGTTRDLLEADVVWDGLRVRLLDGAGLRASEDPVEREGVGRVRRAAESADLLVYVFEAGTGWTAEDREHYARLDPARRTLVLNKADLGGPAGTAMPDGESPLAVSALTGEGLAALRRSLRARLGADLATAGEEGVYLARRRHLRALEETAEALERARTVLEGDGFAELVAEEIRSAQRALAAILGEDADERLLDDVFRRFCIGK